MKITGAELVMKDVYKRQAMREEIGYLMKHVSDVNHKELEPAKILEIFTKEFVNRKDIYQLKDATFQRLPQ